tara:strand:- start:653 stop:1144 length:492 start_codon:yes stop_codon:yes gene_type:complete
MTVTHIEDKRKALNDAIDNSLTNQVLVHIPIEPVPKGRPRITVRGGYARAYTPAKTAQFEAAAATFIRSYWRALDPMVGPVAMEITVCRSRPKRLCRKKDPDGAIPCDTKPDIDNFVKAILDASEKAQVFANGDQQVWQLTVMKMWAPKGQSGFILVKYTYQK